MAAFVFSLLLASGLQVALSDYTLTLLHTNDVHARFEEFNKYGSECSPEDSAAKKCFGGFARRITKVRELRQEYPDLLFLDGGDQFQGTLWFYEHKGKAVSHFMNQIGYDAMTFGNHEFDLGIPGLLPFLRNTTVSMVSANIDAAFEPDMADKFTPSKIFEKGGKRIGVIGYTTPDTVVLSYPGDLVFNEEVSSVQAEATKLRAEGVDIVIALGHAGFGVDKKIANEVDGVDIVIGGHTNTFLFSGDAPSGEDPEGDYPTVITQANGKKVLCVQDYAYGKYLGFMRITFSDDGEVMSWEGNPIIMDGTVERDAATLVDMATWKEPLQELATTVIGRSHVLLDGSENCRLYECNLGNLLADSAVSRHLKHPDEIYWSNVTMALINGGSIRTSIDQGDITIGEVLDAQPFMNTMDLVQMKGKHIREVLEFGVAGYDLEEKAGKFMQVAGMKITYDLGKPDGQRVVKVLVKCTKCQVPKYVEMEDEISYKFITNAYLVSGGDGFSMIKENMEQHHIFGDLDSDVLIEYIEATSPIITGIEGRIEFVSDQEQPKCTNAAAAANIGHLWSLAALLVVLAIFQ